MSVVKPDVLDGLTEVTTDTIYTTDRYPVLVRGVPAQAANYCLVVHSSHLSLELIKFKCR